MIPKDLFVKGMNCLLRQEELMDQLSDGLREMGLAFNGEDRREDLLVELLDAGLDLDLPPSHGGMVSWWLYDCSRDRKIGAGGHVMIAGRSYRITTPEELYDFAVAYKELQP